MASNYVEHIYYKLNLFYVCFDARGETSAGIPETFYRPPQEYWLLNGKEVWASIVGKSA